ncbi:hypothetical protein P1P68_32295 [Streptomyces scabiei]|uniref:hypothetical protein n=1 Tax=Streptomyces scabiei TaxID=1930 RepID=UPI002990066D|nr:hypothetical protein [Streptomyces scabiei]MDW8809358.1 hypothetical protein [Streptomyces scabiei]
MTWGGLPRAVAQSLLPDRLSRDRGIADQAQDQGYGLVSGLTGRLIPKVVEGLVGAVVAPSGSAGPVLVAAAHFLK